MNNHAPTFETCKRLKQAGFPQDTLFLFGFMFNETKLYSRYEKDTAEYYPIYQECAAPILTEMSSYLNQQQITLAPQDWSRIMYSNNPAEELGKICLEVLTHG